MPLTIPVSLSTLTDQQKTDWLAETENLIVSFMSQMQVKANEISTTGDDNDLIYREMLSTVRTEFGKRDEE